MKNSVFFGLALFSLCILQNERLVRSEVLSTARVEDHNRDTISRFNTKPNGETRRFIESRVRDVRLEDQRRTLSSEERVRVSRELPEERVTMTRRLTLARPANQERAREHRMVRSEDRSMVRQEESRRSLSQDRLSRVAPNEQERRVESRRTQMFGPFTGNRHFGSGTQSNESTQGHPQNGHARDDSLPRSVQPYPIVTLTHPTAVQWSRRPCVSRALSSPVPFVPSSSRSALTRNDAQAADDDPDEDAAIQPISVYEQRRTMVPRKMQPVSESSVLYESSAIWSGIDAAVRRAVRVESSAKGHRGNDLSSWPSPASSLDDPRRMVREDAASSRVRDESRRMVREDAAGSRVRDESRRMVREDSARVREESRRVVREAEERRFVREIPNQKIVREENEKRVVREDNRRMDMRPLALEIKRVVQDLSEAKASRDNNERMTRERIVDERRSIVDQGNFGKSFNLEELSASPKVSSWSQFTSAMFGGAALLLMYTQNNKKLKIE
ncbi:hypothetical protein Ocin01_02178 [Orchesella cincta]|uniref:Uncharacterized protein n=1 Tax=Orchesella cincta TaxID=48709 RepID=A0A1D2NGT3_ORCCI|nr:hypothetical protein Ocin01_02178 [Orchesella cincta]